MSVLLQAADSSPELLARLNLHAVLPAYGDLLRHLSEARAVLGDARFCLRIAAGTLATDLVFSNGRCRQSSNLGVEPHCILRYRGYEQLSRHFAGGRGVFPMPVRGLHRVRCLRRFATLGTWLQAGLAGESGLMALGVDARRARELHLRLSFSVALAAGCILAEYEAFSRKLLAESGDWAIQFEIAEIGLRAWVRRQAGRCHWGRGRAPVPALATLTMDGPGTALAALSGKLDNFAAVNTGTLRIIGLAPLVDKFGVVLERVALYLQPPSA